MSDNKTVEIEIKDLRDLFDIVLGGERLHKSNAAHEEFLKYERELLVKINKLLLSIPTPSSTRQESSTPVSAEMVAVEKIRKESGVYIWAYPITYRDVNGKVEKITFGWELEWPSGKTSWYIHECSTYEEALNEGIKSYQ